MRAGGCTVQQALTAEAAGVVKQAVTLARRRGHAQVTPLHVANTMLAATNGLLRTACLQSHSHPLQCKALELCFNVALNRLPASTSSPMLGPHSQHPSISNALSKENPVRNEDVMSVIENLMNKRRKNTVIVGECLATIEGVVRGVMDKVDKGDVPEALRDVKLISLPLFSFGHHSREEVEQKLGELKSLVKSCVGRGVILYLEDLKWTTDYRASSSEQGRNYYCPVEHMIMELGKLVCGFGENGRFWLMGIATFQTYSRCRTGHPSLETIWSLHPLTIPASSLALSLMPDSDLQSQFSSKKAGSGTSNWLMLEGGAEKQLTCCADCSANFENEARSIPTSTCNSDSTTSTLPTWLQQYKDENKKLSRNDQDCVAVRDLCKKWNSICSSAHKQPHSSEKTLTFSSLSPSSSTSGFSYDQQYPNLHQTHQAF
ncbi:unnamed protein product, partial [Vitis vinifera]